MEWGALNSQMKKLLFKMGFSLLISVVLMTVTIVLVLAAGMVNNEVLSTH
jgi:hypothetical protein